MPQQLAELLVNREPIAEQAGRILGSSEYTELFNDLQSNILTSHGFDRAHYFFVRFRPDQLDTLYLLGMLAHNAFERVMIQNALVDPSAREAMSPRLRKPAAAWTGDAPERTDAETRALLADLRVVSEYEVYWQRVDERAGRAPNGQRRDGYGGRPSRFTVNVLLTCRGYQKLGASPPDSPAFVNGMTRPGAPIVNPDDWDHLSTWGDVDALLVVAYDPAADAGGQTRQERQVAAFRQVVSDHADLLFEEIGNVLRGRDGNPIEPFGFRDGISQPVFYASQKESLRASGEADQNWDPKAALGLILCPDPNGRTPYACGTYFVFRKLQQDLQKFHDQSVRLASGKGWTAEELQEFFVGRKRNGAPLVGPALGQNDFDFKGDARGQGCPFHSHVRKSNPRSDVLPAYDSKRHRIARRSIPYGPKVKRTPDGVPVIPVELESGETAGEVGLLFMCAQRDIETQFEHLQALWSDKPDHPRARRTGVDTVTGQLSPGQPNRLAIDDKARPLTAGLVDDYEPVVQLRGGAYFFAPSVGFLRALLGDFLKSN